MYSEHLFNITVVSNATPQGVTKKVSKNLKYIKNIYIYFYQAFWTLFPYSLFPAEPSIYI